MSDPHNPTRQSSSNGRGDGSSSSEHISEATVIEWLKGCQKVTADRSTEIFNDYVKVLDEKLLDFVDSAKTNAEVTSFQENLREFRLKGKEFRRFFIGYLSEGFIKFKNKQLETSTGEEKFRGDMLSLVDNEDLEETIALSSVTHRAEDAHTELLWFLHQRFGALNDGEKVDLSNNPVSPVQFCEALRKAVKVLSVSTKAKIIAYKVFDKEFMPLLGGVLEDVNRYLIKQNILPNLSFSNAYADQGGAGSVSMPEFQQFDDAGSVDTNAVHGNLPPQAPGQAPVQMPRAFGGPQPLPQSTVVSTPDPNAPVEEYQGRLVDAIRVLQSHIAHNGVPPAEATQLLSQSQTPPPAASAGSAAAPRVTGGRPVQVYSNQQVVTALQGLQQQASTASIGFEDTPTGQIQAITPQVIAEVGEQLADELKKEGEDAEVDPVDMHTIELVGMLFEYMLSDEHLPDSIKAILSYLHTPFLKVAFLDKTFFEETEHPARLLLNSLAEAGTRWVSNDGTSQYEIYTKVKQTVSRVLEDFEKDVRLFAELLLEFSSYVKKIGRRQDLMEKRAMEKVQGEEKLREVKIKVNQEVRSRTDGKELPSAVLLLLLQPWSDYLAFLLLRYGEESESWQKALEAVDNILWSIEPKQEAKDKAKQTDLLDDLLDIIESGFETIGYDQTKGKKLVEALVSLQPMAMQSKKAEPAPAPMRDKLETLAAEKAGTPEEPTEKASPEEEKMVENLKMIEFGTWFEFDGGKRLKVAWYNSKTMHYMLVDQMGKKVAMKSGLELARAMLKGSAKVIAGSTKPFFERALENIFQSLNAKAEAIKPDSAAG